MTEGRQTQVVLLDDRTLDILVKPRLLSGELLDLVSSHFNIKEKEYFGLAYPDDSNHFNWLTLDKRVLEHEFPKRSGPLTLYFAIRFYIQSITQLRDKSTVEAFVISAKSLIYKGEIECDSETAFELAAHVLQADCSDYITDQKTRDDLKTLPVLPTSALQEHPSIDYCEERVIYHYQTLAGTEKGLALVNYMTIVESLPTYGIHYYDVKDKKDIPWWLGISFKGIALYDKNDKRTPRKLFTWRQLENLYYRDRKFSIEVHDPKRVVQSLSSFNLYEDAIRERSDRFDSLSDAITDPTTQVSVSRRAFGPGNVNVHAWFVSTPQLTKCVWSMAVAQHQFYLDRKHSRSSLPAARSMSELAAELSRSTASLASASSNLSSDLSSTCQRSMSTHSLPSLSASKFELNYEDVEKAREAQKDMFDALTARKDALETTLKKKLEELKLLCIKEGELSGELPPETPIQPGENPPLIRRRIGTAFTLSPSAVQRTEDDSTDELSQLELEYDLQSKISNAALKLSKDKTVPKKLRKQRHLSYQKAQAKLKETGLRLSEKRKKVKQASQDLNCAFIKPSENVIGRTDSGMYSESSMMSSDESLISRHYNSSKNLQDSCYSSDSSRYSSSYTSIPPPHANLPTSTPSHPQHMSRHSSGYITSPIYTTQTQYRSRRYPTLSNTDRDSSVSLRRDARYGSEDSIRESTRQPSMTSRYDSMEELKSPDRSSGISTESGLHNNSYNEANNRFVSPQPVQNAVVSRTNVQQEGSPGYYGSLDRMKRRKNQAVVASQNSQNSDNSRTTVNHEKPRSDSYDMSRLRASLSDARVAPVGSDSASPVRTGSEPDYSRIEPDYSRVDTSSLYTRSGPDNVSRLEYSDTSRVNSPDSISYVSRRSDLRSENTSTYSPRYVEGAYRYYERSRQEPKPKRNSGSHLVVKRESPASINNTQPQNPSRVDSTRVDSMRVDTTPPSPNPNYSPHSETTKPYEMSDFYKYSEKFRRHQAINYYHNALIGGNGDQISVSSLASQFSSGSDASFQFQSPSNRRYVTNSSTRSSPIGSSSRSSDSVSHRPPSGPYSTTKHSTPFTTNNNNPYSPYNTQPVPGHQNATNYPTYPGRENNFNNSVNHPDRNVSGFPDRNNSANNYPNNSIAYANSLSYTNYSSSDPTQRNHTSIDPNQRNYSSSANESTNQRNYSNNPDYYQGNNTTYNNSVTNYPSGNPGHFTYTSTTYPGSPTNYETTINFSSNSANSAPSSRPTYTPQHGLYTPPRPLTCDPVSDKYVTPYQKR